MAAEDGDSSDDGRECKGETSKQAQSMRERAEWLAGMEIEREERKMIRLQKRKVQAVLRTAQTVKEQVFRSGGTGQPRSRTSTRMRLPALPLTVAMELSLQHAIA